ARVLTGLSVVDAGYAMLPRALRRRLRYERLRRPRGPSERCRDAGASATRVLVPRQPRRRHPAEPGRSHRPVAARALRAVRPGLPRAHALHLRAGARRCPHLPVAVEGFDRRLIVTLASDTPGLRDRRPDGYSLKVLSAVSGSPLI